MDPRELFTPGSILAGLLVAAWVVAILGAAFVTLVIYAGAVILATPVIGLIWGHKAKNRVVNALLEKPLDRITSGVTWPKRQIERQRFYREFGFKPWEFHRFSDQQRQIIDAKLSETADALDRAVAREGELQQRGNRYVAVTMTEIMAARMNVADAKKRFWHLHWLAGRMARYPDCAWYGGCSFKEHLTKNIVRRAS